ncbi:MAG: 2-succinyl-5-enolpyruvyl-6-hydroxy-3-cyclohexene-1-carboxylic-acid synthase [Opitutaceae bacterium]|nr:2-succinyl-5-enolpyruvyl-6-hydroxy-3-cyclohexene-1-carboxylic-acid synthase [Opitutaceae bacterium]
MAVKHTHSLKGKIIPKFVNTNEVWSWIIVETLARLGIKTAVICPGARSAPLTFAFTKNTCIEAISLLDERSAGFFALGCAKREKRPVVLVCTSGTAAANFFPAVIEASEAGVSLLILTADRPPELRNCHAGQTIDQVKLYGAYPRWQVELALPECKSSLFAYLRQTIMHASDRSMASKRGPVHLNIPFRDPLSPISEKDREEPLSVEIVDDFFDHLEESEGSVVFSHRSLPSGFGKSSRGIIIAGPAEPDDPESYVEDVAVLANKLGWPVLAEGLNPLRNIGRKGFAPIVHYEAILRNASLAATLNPDEILCLGPLPTSKTLREWLGQSNARILFTDPSVDNLDPLHTKSRHLNLPVGCLRELVETKRKRKKTYLESWLQVDRSARLKIGRTLGATEFAFEGKVAFELSKCLQRETPLFISNSMPVRDMEFFWSQSNRKVRPFFNRGANGIDGILSTALGLAHRNKPSVLLTGDLALLHDTNGFLAKRSFKGSLTIVLINNNGGGIFEMLPVSRFNPPFEKYFATPQDVDFSKLCQSYGVSHRILRDWKHFRKAVSDLPSSGIRVLEIQTNRKKDTVLRRELLDKVAASLAV